MQTIQIELTDAQYMALEYAAISPQEWIRNLVAVRAQEATDIIVSAVVEKCLADGVQIPSSKDEIVTFGFSQGWVKTAEQSHADVQAAYEAEQAAQQGA